jgi:protein-S-isoprenylcysteine O-methyltransferase Ste14
MIQRTKLYDLLVAAPIIAWFIFCASQVLPTLSQQIALVRLILQTDPSVLPPALALSTVSHITTFIFLAVLVIMFAVRLVPQQTVTDFFPRAAAVAATFIGVSIVLLPPKELSPALFIASLILLISGTGFALCAVLALGRSISIVPEARRLVVHGPYALVRHPIYLGETVAMTGIVLQYISAWAVLLFGLQLALQLQRIKYEERLLIQVFPEYGSYTAHTARLVPGVY